MGNIFREGKADYASYHRRGDKEDVADGKGDGGCGYGYRPRIPGVDSEEYRQDKDEYRKGEMGIVAVDARKDGREGKAKHREKEAALFPRGNIQQLEETVGTTYGDSKYSDKR